MPPDACLHFGSAPADRADRAPYGIDRNPMAVDLAKVSLWLSTLARDHPFTFVDHAFRRGDSLVGTSQPLGNAPPSHPRIWHIPGRRT